MVVTIRISKCPGEWSGGGVGEVDTLVTLALARMTRGQFHQKVPRTKLKSVLGHFLGRA